MNTPQPPQQDTAAPGSVQPAGSVKEVAVVMGALLRKHGIIDAAAIDDPEGYDNYETVGRLLRVAEDWWEWYSPNDQSAAAKESHA